MGKYVGLDWASKGWFGVILRDDGWETDFFPSVWSVWKYHSDATRILIDIPIGLPSRETGRRACDVKAKDVLDRRHRSVFYAPVREAVYETNIETAKDINERAGFSIQNQAWGIVPRIREVDEFLDTCPGARDRVRETHPEVCFRALKAEPLTHGKGSEDGREERLAVIREADPTLGAAYEHVREEYGTPSYAPLVGSMDDALDAIVAGLTARRDEGELATLPQSPPVDRRGLPMEIVYPSSTVQTRLSAIRGTRDREG